MIHNSRLKIPFLSVPDKPITSSTQDFLPIADIDGDIILFKDGGSALVLESTSLNFGLLSEKEQEAVIAAYAALINSLSFSIQLLIRTQRKEIAGYLTYLESEIAKITDPKLLGFANGYRDFITDSVKKKVVLGKKFYVVIPFSPFELGASKSIASSVKRSGPLPFPKSYVVKKSKITLYPRRDHLIRQAARLGLKLKQLTTLELIEMAYHVYNPLPPAVKKELKL